MIVHVLYNQFSEEVKRVSCDGIKLVDTAIELNGEDELGPYVVLTFTLEDYKPEPPVKIKGGTCNDCGQPLGGLCPKCRYTLVNLKR